MLKSHVWHSGNGGLERRPSRSFVCGSENSLPIKKLHWLNPEAMPPETSAESKVLVLGTHTAFVWTEVRISNLCHSFPTSIGKIIPCLFGATRCVTTFFFAGKCLTWRCFELLVRSDSRWSDEYARVFRVWKLGGCSVFAEGQGWSRERHKRTLKWKDRRNFASWLLSYSWVVLQSHLTRRWQRERTHTYTYTYTHKHTHTHTHTHTHSQTHVLAGSGLDDSTILDSKGQVHTTLIQVKGNNGWQTQDTAQISQFQDAKSRSSFEAPCDVLSPFSQVKAVEVCVQNQHRSSSNVKAHPDCGANHPHCDCKAMPGWALLRVSRWRHLPAVKIN